MVKNGDGGGPPRRRGRGTTGDAGAKGNDIEQTGGKAWWKLEGRSGGDPERLPRRGRRARPVQGTALPPLDPICGRQ